ncbi:hypothetical protein [Streptomyces sp. SM1]|uniref:hypothetical protein n=1 Tax=Streptomyces sp. SM1 TaxID=402229 RepID=UPI0021563F61|nr:hypothetical protein [Streptomyces sp. SM1]
MATTRALPSPSPVPAAPPRLRAVDRDETVTGADLPPPFPVAVPRPAGPPDTR